MKALIALSFVCLIIGLGWLWFSYGWNKLSKAAEFIAEHSDFIVEKSIPMKRKGTIFSQHISRWQECDLFLLPDGMILKGPKNSMAFNDCAFLHFAKSPPPSLPRGFTYVGKYKKPKVSNNLLEYYLLLYIDEVGSKGKGEGYGNFILSPDEKTIEILRQKDLL